MPESSCKGATTGAVRLLLLVPDHQTITVKIENLDTISATVEEEEEVAGQDVQAEALLDQSGKAVKRGIFLIRLPVKTARMDRS